MKRIIRTLLRVSVSFALIINAAYSIDDLKEIKLPVERENCIEQAPKIDANNAIKPQNPFSIGEKTVLRDPSTGSARRVIGAAEKIPGYATVNESNLEEAAAAFLKSKEKELNLKGIELRLKSKTHVNGRWYVSYNQVYKGVDVLLTEVIIRIFDNGNVAHYGADVVPGIQLNVLPKLSYEAAINKLHKEVEGKARVDAMQSSKTPYILPIKNASGVFCRLVWRAELLSDDGKRFINYVDADEGNTLWRFEKTKSAANVIQVSGQVRENMATDEPKTLRFANMKVNVGGTDYFTDRDGKINLENDANAPVVASFAGKYARVSKKNGGGLSSQITDTLRPGAQLNLDWNDNNSHAFERSTFYHANLIHDDLKSIDPNLTVMDVPMSVVLDFSGQSANAYSNGRDTIVFLAAENAQANMPESPSILYHEYTHSLNGMLYESLGEQDGMINFSANEGMADLYGCLLQGQSKIGLGTFKDDPSRFIRCVDNNNVYPDNLGSDSHYNGQILSGAYWDLAKTTSIDFVKRLSHFVKYAKPDDPNIGVAYSEWFLETLIADDDDGDLSNGTPRSKEIIAAFNKHHIGTDLLITQTFEHTPLTDTQDTTNALAVEFKLAASKLPGAKFENAKVVYSLDNWTTASSIAAEDQGSGLFKAVFPRLAAGSFVTYHIQATDSYSGREINLLKEKYSKENVTFVVGYKSAIYDNCENGENWSIGDPNNDDGYFGAWECATPQLVDLTELSGGQFGLMQLGADHSPEGSKCFVTDPTGLDPYNPGTFAMYMTMGRTTLYSPTYSLANLEKPIVKFWRFNKLEQLTYFEKKPNMQVYVSTNNGSAWTLAAKYETSTGDWIPELINLQALAPGADAIQLKFVSENEVDFAASKLNICESMIDDVEIQSINGTLSASDGINSGNKISVYPNPVAEFINIDSEEPGSLALTDALGVARYKSSIETGRTTLNLSSLPAGVYFVRLTNQNGVNICKFIKK